MGQPPEFFIDQRHQAVHRPGIAFLPLLQQLRDSALVLGDHEGSTIFVPGCGMNTMALRSKIYEAYAQNIGRPPESCNHPVSWQVTVLPLPVLGENEHGVSLPSREIHMY